MLQPVWSILIVAIVIALAIYLLGKIWGKSPPLPTDPMPQNQIVLLVAYLLGLGLALVFMVVSLNSLDFPATPVVPQEVEIPTPTPTPDATTAAAATNPAQPQAPTPNPTPVVPILLRIFPQAMVASNVVGSPPNPKLAIYGKNFTAGSSVRFNLKPVAIEYISDNLLRASLEASDLVGKGAITVDVKNPDGAISNAIPVPIEKPLVKLNVFFVAYPVISREVQLLLLVIFAGALGSYLHAIMSLADYISKGELTSSYFWWYISRPFLGMAMALVFYAVLRGGFLAGTPADANVVNPFGVVTIGALVGMFSYKAAQKLGEIFDVIFKAGPPSAESEGDKPPVITKLDPDSVTAGGTDPVPVKIIGEGLGDVSTVSVNDDPREPNGVTDKEVTFTLQPADIEQPGEIKVTASNADGSSADSTLPVTEPVVAEPVVTDPVVTEPVVTEPVVTDPVVTEPVVTDPVVIEPVEPQSDKPAED